MPLGVERDLKADDLVTHGPPHPDAGTRRGRRRWGGLVEDLAGDLGQVRDVEAGGLPGLTRPA
jgi:hypothetical protein